jgi:ATP-dependent Clp protease adapter protein ClpS
MDKQNYFPGWEKLISAWALSTESPTTGTKIMRPPMYNVLIFYNKNIPINFFLDLLKQFFYFSQEECNYSIQDLTVKGHIVCGRFTREVIENKIAKINDFARTYSYPLKCLMRMEEEYVSKKS